MLHCDHCGTDLVDGACPEGHAAGDPNVVVPAGGPSASVRDAGSEGRLISLAGSGGVTGSVLSEALGALAAAQDHDQQQAAAQPDPPPHPDDEVFETSSEHEAPGHVEVAGHAEVPTTRVEPEETFHDFMGVGPVEEVDGATEPAPEGDADAPREPAPAPGTVAIGGDLIAKPVRAPSERRPRALLAIPLVLALLGGAGVFFVFGSNGTAEAAVYRRVFTPKESHTYRFTMSMDGAVEAGPATEQMDVSMGMTVTERTMSVDAEGVATIEQSIDAAEMSVNGQRASIPELSGVSITVRMAPDGRVLDVDGLGAFGFGDTGPIGELMGPNTMGPLLPSDEVAPGDEWTVSQEVPNPLVDEPLKMTARNRLVERKVDGGVETALIRSELDLPMDLRISMRQLLALAEQSAGQSFPDAGFPKKAVFVYAGGMTMDLLQTVEVASGRPIRITGDGEADLRMKIEGIPGGMPEMRMRMKMKVSMSELRGAARAASSGFAPEPLLMA